MFRDLSFPTDWQQGKRLIAIPTKIRKVGEDKALQRMASLSHRPAYQVIPVLVLVVSAIILGGGGSPAPRSELLLQLLTAACLLAMLFGPTRIDKARPLPRSALAATGLLLTLPLLQLIPLPPSIWQSMPGRNISYQALALVGAENEWRPWTLFPGRTLAGLLALVPAAAMLLAVSRLSPSERSWLAPVIAALAVCSILLGAAQLTGGPNSALRFYSYSNPGFLNGFQANRNAQADILLIGLMAAVVSLDWLRARKIRRLPANLPMRLSITSHGIVAAGLASLFGIGIIMTGSRAGMALLLAVVIAAAFLWFGQGRKFAIAAVVLGSVALAGGLLLLGNTALRQVAERFSFEGEMRSELWADAIFAIGQYWPFGSGLGSAGPVLIAVERLELVDQTIPNRVHNDYLEWALEGGLFAIVIAALLAALLIWKIAGRMRSGSQMLKLENYLAITTLAVLALHSIVDYPLRSMSLAMLGAAAVGALLGRTDCRPDSSEMTGYAE